MRISYGLGCSLKEAEEVYNYDKAIDNNEKTEFDLDPAKKKIEKQMRLTGTRKSTAYNFTTRKRKPDEIKEAIIAGLATFLQENSEFFAENIEIVNKGKKISFTIGEDSFSIDLIRHTKSKK